MKDDERRWSELCARKALGRYYRAKGVTTRWETGSEPPDWWAYLDEVRFAIEVTRAYGSLVPAGETVYKAAPEQRAFFFKLGREIHSLVSAIPDSGSHYLHMQAMKITQKERAEVLARVEDYVLSNLSAPRAEEAVVLKKKGKFTSAKITIEKKSRSGAGVGYSYSQGSLPRSGSDIEAELREIVTSAIKTKISRISEIDEPKILVIVDTYHRAPETFWTELQFDAGHFSAVFRASSDGYCQLLSEGAYYAKSNR